MEGRKEESGKGIGLGGLGTAVNGARRRRCHHPTADSGGQGRGEAPPTLPSKRARPGQQASPWRPSALSTRPPVAVRGAAALCKWGKTKTVSVGASPSPPPHASHPPWPPVPSVPPSAASRPPSSLGLDSPGSTCTPNPPSPPPGRHYGKSGGRGQGSWRCKMPTPPARASPHSPPPTRGGWPPLAPPAQRTPQTGQSGCA